MTDILAVTGIKLLLMAVIVVFVLGVLWLVGLGTLFQRDKPRRDYPRGNGGGDDEWEPAPPLRDVGASAHYTPPDPPTDFPAAMCTPSRRPLSGDAYALGQVEYLHRAAWGRGPHHQPAQPEPDRERVSVPDERPIEVPNWPARIRR